MAGCISRLSPWSYAGGIFWCLEEALWHRSFHRRRLQEERRREEEERRRREEEKRREEQERLVQEREEAERLEMQRTLGGKRDNALTMLLMFLEPFYNLQFIQMSNLIIIFLVFHVCFFNLTAEERGEPPSWTQCATGFD